jgi:hypothetical protein
VARARTRGVPADRILMSRAPDGRITDGFVWGGGIGKTDARWRYDT